MIYDWLSFSTKIDTKSSVIELLGLKDLPFQDLKGFYGYRDRKYFDGIGVHFNGRRDMGVLVEMSGNGCRAWEQFGTGDYDGLFKLISNNYSTKSEERKMNLTRLDVAYDDFKGLLDLEVLKKDTEAQNFVSRFKDWQVIQGTSGDSVIHGSRKSDVYIRIYDKRAQLELDEIYHWVRCEIQLRKERAMGFINLPGVVDLKYFEVLNNYLRYTVPSDDTNVSRRANAPYWDKWLATSKKSSVYTKPGTDYNLNNLLGFAIGQGGAAISTAINILGVDSFMKLLFESRKYKTISPKYLELLNRYDAGFSNEVLKFLDERGVYEV
jgi:phage replication initiation protein